MTYILGQDRSQILLLPEVLDDYVDPDNLVRVIDAFVDGLDLAAASFSRVEPKMTGRPGYALADLLKLSRYIRLAEPGAIEWAAGGRNPLQYRGDLTAASPEAGLQYHR
jgi:hypothetical protein